MPGHYGGRSSRSSRGGGRDRHPPARPSRPTRTVTTAKAPPSILSRDTPITTAKAPPSILSRDTPITTAKAPPSILSRDTPVTTGGASPFPYTRPKPIISGVARINKFRKFISDLPKKGLNWFNEATGDWGDEEEGNLLQIMANMPKYWDLPTDLKNAIKTGQNIPFAHGTKTLDDYYDLARTGFQTARTKYIPTAYDWFKGTNPFKAEGVFGAVGTKAEDALKAATQYAKGAVLRGGALGKTTGKVFEGMIDPAKAYINRGLTGVIQARVPSDVANRAFNLPEWMSGKSGVKAFTEPGLHRIGSRLFPGANIGLGVASAVEHLKNKNYGQALMAGISAIPGPVGYAGLGGELALGALQKNPIPDYTGVQGLESGMQIGRNYNRGGVANLLYGGIV